MSAAISKVLSFGADFPDIFELKRIIFGLSALIKTPGDKLPKIVEEKVPDIMNQMILLTKKMHNSKLNALLGVDRDAQ